jgi:hypothetical protein
MGLISARKRYIDISFKDGVRFHQQKSYNFKNGDFM